MISGPPGVCCLGLPQTDSSILVLGEGASGKQILALQSSGDPRNFSALACRGSWAHLSGTKKADALELGIPTPTERGAGVPGSLVKTIYRLIVD